MEPAKNPSVAASSLFLALIAAALLIGGHATIDPLLRSAVEARQAKGMGDVYTTPDGVFCRHMAFDDLPSEIAAAVERCPGGISGRRPSPGH